MSKQVSAIVQGDNITMMVDGKDYLISKGSHKRYEQIRDAVMDGDYEKAAELIDVSSTINLRGNGNITVEKGLVRYKGKAIDNSLTRRLVDMMYDGHNVSVMVNFLDNLMQNPSKHAVQDLYRFLEHNSLPLTPDGHFLAYKKVREDYKDIYTGTVDNSVGNTVSMSRFEVCDDHHKTCSTGLHFCSKDYLPHFGSGDGNHVMILKINPRDVVSIPMDYNNAKGRCCLYEVVGEYVTDDYSKEAFDAPVVEFGATASAE